MVKLILVRALPGLGKTTKAKTLVAANVVDTYVEADQFFTVGDKYYYDSEYIKDAHQYCISRTSLLLSQGLSVVVSNTFVSWWEMQPYVCLAHKRDWVSLDIIEAMGGTGSTHNVPRDVIERMKLKWMSTAQARSKAGLE